MNRGIMFGVIALLAAVSFGASYLYYQERQSGITIEIDDTGVSIDGS